MNDTELIQRREGLFTEGRWSKRPIAEILALNTHIKRHPRVEFRGETSPRSIEQEDSYYVGHVCFIDRLTGLSRKLTIDQALLPSTMQEESPSPMIAPLSDGNAHGIYSSSEATLVKDEPHTGAKAGNRDDRGRCDCRGCSDSDDIDASSP